MGLNPASVEVLFIAHRADHLRHCGLRRRTKLARLDCTVTELLALCYRTNKPNQIHAACQKVVGSSPGAANFFLI